MNKKTFILLFIIAMASLLLSCSKKENNEDEGYKVMFLHKSETRLVSETYNTDTTNTYDLVEELIDQMSNPYSRDELSPGFDFARVESFDINTEGYLILNFSSGYFKLSNFKEILCRAAIVKTLCQIEGINGVEFYVNGFPLTDVNGQGYGYMTEETFVDNTYGEATYKQKVRANLYFSSADGKHLVQVPSSVTFDGTISLEQLVLGQLIKGPSVISGVDESLIPSIAPDTVINQIKIRDQICYLDLSKEFLTGVDGVKREVTIYGIVNSLIDLSNINKVQFTIDGKMVEYFGNSDIRFDAPFERNLEIIKN